MCVAEIGGLPGHLAGRNKKKKSAEASARLIAGVKAKQQALKDLPTVSTIQGIQPPK